jgi:hypothetical protein
MIVLAGKKAIFLFLYDPSCFINCSFDIWQGDFPHPFFILSSLKTYLSFMNLLEDWLLSLMSTLVMGFGPED